MIKLAFSEFYKGEFVDEGYELYIVRDLEESCMYIGISRKSVWDRWFGGINSHMELGADASLHGNTAIGEAIQRRFPDSWSWMIELWTKEDCCASLRNELNESDLRRLESQGIQAIETYLIKKVRPLYNFMHAGGRHEDPLITERLNNAYDKIFGRNHPED
jgi:hypothetical protein